MIAQSGSFLLLSYAVTFEICRDGSCGLFFKIASWPAVSNKTTFSFKPGVVLTSHIANFVAGLWPSCVNFIGSAVYSCCCSICIRSRRNASKIHSLSAWSGIRQWRKYWATCTKPDPLSRTSTNLKPESPLRRIPWTQHTLFLKLSGLQMRTNIWSKAPKLNFICTQLQTIHRVFDLLHDFHCQNFAYGPVTRMGVQCLLLHWSDTQKSYTTTERYAIS